MTYDVIVYRHLDNKVTKITARNRPKGGDTGSAESAEESALNTTNTLDNGVAIVPTGSHRVGDIYREE